MKDIILSGFLNGGAGGGSAGVTSWNDLKDKPFGEEYSTTSDTLTWDGNAEGLLSVMEIYHHVSDAVLTPDDFLNGCTTTTYNGREEGSFFYELEELTAFYELYGIIYSDEFLVIPQDDYNIEDMGLFFPKAGIYFAGEHGDGSPQCSYYSKSLTIPGYGQFSGIFLKKLDEKYIPNSVASKEYVEKALETADGYDVTASGEYSHAEGISTTASGDGSHAEGYHAESSGGYSHAEGHAAKAEGAYSHSEGSKSRAIGHCSHAEGYEAIASGEYSHAEGYKTEASGKYSHAEGYCTIATALGQHVEGYYNIEDTVSSNDSHGKYIHIVGNGYSATTERSNAHTIDWGGVGWFKGGLKVGGAGQDDAEAVSVLTTAEMENITQTVMKALRDGGYIQ